jgi:hypothetical protein
MIQCPECKTTNQSSARFCSGCGVGFTVIPQPVKKKNSFTTLVIVLSVLGLCGLCGIFGAIGNKQNKAIETQINTSPSALISTPNQTPKPGQTYGQILVDAKNLLAKQDLNSKDLAIQYLGSIPNNAPEYKEAQSLIAKDAPRRAEAARPELEKIKAVWKKGGFGSIGVWTVTIRNNTNKTLGDIKFKTEYSSESGNIVTRGGTDALLGKDTIQKVIPPKQTRTFEVNDGFISDEANTASFEVVSWREVQ